jgi:CubicO group peptidase (beta-lactamase class C family)
MRAPAIAVFLPVFFFAAASAQPASAPTQFQSVASQIDDAIASGEAPSLALAVIADGEISWMHAAGWADIAARSPATPDTIYRIGSVSKSITATAAAIAARNGVIDLSRPLHRAGRGLRGISLTDLLNMRAGLLQAVYYRGRGGDSLDIAPDQFDRTFAVTAPSARARHAYSNMGPQLVANAVAEAAGEPFASYARRTLLEPLGMTHTFSRFGEAPAHLRARSYRSGLTAFDPEFEIEPAAGAGWVSSLSDLTRYARFHLGERAETVALDLDLRALHEPAAGGHYVFGWGALTSGPFTIWLSDGEVNGGRAVILLAPAQRAGVIALTNGAYDLWPVVLSAMERAAPGFAQAFEESVGRVESDLQRAAVAAHPSQAAWSAHGTVRIGGRSVRLRLIHAEDGALRIALGAADFAAGVAADPEDGFLRWSMACPSLLPACAQGADATLVLTRAGARSLEGAIVVESRLGLFPYAVRARAR